MCSWRRFEEIVVDCQQHTKRRTSERRMNHQKRAHQQHQRKKRRKDETKRIENRRRTRRQKAWCGRCNTYCRGPHGKTHRVPRPPRTAGIRACGQTAPRHLCPGDLRHPQIEREKLECRSFEEAEKSSGWPTKGWGPSLICRTSALQMGAIEHRPGGGRAVSNAVALGSFEADGVSNFCHLISLCA